MNEIKSTKKLTLNHSEKFIKEAIERFITSYRYSEKLSLSDLKKRLENLKSILKTNSNRVKSRFQGAIKGKIGEINQKIKLIENQLLNGNKITKEIEESIESLIKNLKKFLKTLETL